MAPRRQRSNTRVVFRSHDTRIRPAETMVCPGGHDFGLDRQRFYATQGHKRTVTCPICGTPTPLMEVAS